MSGVKRDCQCATVKHEHGTTIAYQSDGCRCDECREACRVVSAARARAIAYGRYDRWRRDPVGARRRLQALACLGWNKRTLSEAAGIAPSQLDRLMMRPVKWVHARVHLSVAEAYDRLWDQPPPTVTQAQRRSATIARNRAAERGWVPPLSWDDDEIDDPTATPHLPGNGGWDLAQCGTPAAARRHHRRKEPLCEACKAADRRNSAETRARRLAA